MDVATTVNTAASSASATLTGLTSTTAYEYRLTDGEISVATGEFTTAAEIALQNGSLDGWDGSSPNAATDSKFWDTSNEGAKMGDLPQPVCTRDHLVQQIYGLRLRPSILVNPLPLGLLRWKVFINIRLMW